ncbi:MAG: (2Fe-2S)-binding protein [Pseudonocardia sp. SCN 73-27]|nr:MAG: (2Fe-2S)-binding protein [Pseudonocardia sp. SCN 72-51]ODV03040.1 MAG: (2Fe-2S)-binding protein [Pseudonocardia sp. SCN 73-27]
MTMHVDVEINGVRHRREVEPRTLLSDFLRHDLGLTGTHVGCEHGVCGACTVQVDGRPVRSCLVLAVQTHGRSVRTVEDLSDPEDDVMHPLQEAFHANHALQCGFCTPGILMTIEALSADLAEMSDAAILEALSGNLCRCTGYRNIVCAIRAAGEPGDGEGTGSWA